MSPTFSCGTSTCSCIESCQIWCLFSTGIQVKVAPRSLWGFAIQNFWGFAIQNFSKQASSEVETTFTSCCCFAIQWLVPSVPPGCWSLTCSDSSAPIDPTQGRSSSFPTVLSCFGWAYKTILHMLLTCDTMDRQNLDISIWMLGWVSEMTACAWPPNLMVSFGSEIFGLPPASFAQKKWSPIAPP